MFYKAPNKYTSFRKILDLKNVNVCSMLSKSVSNMFVDMLFLRRMPSSMRLTCPLPIVIQHKRLNLLYCFIYLFLFLFYFFIFKSIQGTYFLENFSAGLNAEPFSPSKGYYNIHLSLNEGNVTCISSKLFLKTY